MFPQATAAAGEQSACARESTAEGDEEEGRWTEKDEDGRSKRRQTSSERRGGEGGSKERKWKLEAKGKNRGGDTGSRRPTTGKAPQEIHGRTHERKREEKRLRKARVVKNVILT